MCIIIAKNKTDRLPTESELKTSFTKNSDGGGFMYVDNGKVIIDKGYMNWEKFYRHYKTLCKKYHNFKGKSLVIHCRIGTSGTNSKINCHPYPISDNVNYLHKLYFKTDLGLAHNGIINEYNPTNNEKKLDINDTQNFIRKYLSPLKNEYNDFYKSEYIDKGIKSLIGWSKLALLDKDDTLTLIGNFVEDNNLSFSNTTYKEYKYNYSSNNIKEYNSYEDYINDIWNYNYNSKSIY